MGVETLLIAAGASAATGQIFEGIQAQRQGQAAAGVTKAQIGATQVQKYRDTQDLANQQSRALARMRAVFGAQGGAPGGLQESLIMRDQAMTFATERARLLQDYDYRTNTLRATKSNQRLAANQALVGSFLGAGTAAAGTAFGVQNYRASLANPSGGASATTRTPGQPRQLVGALS